MVPQTNYKVQPKELQTSINKPFKQNKTMNTVITIITSAIVAGVIIMLIIMLISTVITDYSFHKRELEYARRVEKEKYYNSLLPNTITFSDMRGFIRAEYAHGRFYVHYECINEDLEHYSRTISFNDDGSIRENYSRLGCKYGFENTMHQEAFRQMKERVREVIKYNVAC